MINQNIRKLRCVIPDGTAGKYPRLLSLFDNNETMTPEYSSMETFMNHLIGDMESHGISVERFSLFKTSRGIAYQFLTAFCWCLYLYTRKTEQDYFLFMILNPFSKT